jgi:FAD/FMN-containing dehydrogenase
MTIAIDTFVAQARTICGAVHVQTEGAIEPRFLVAARHAAGAALAVLRPATTDEVSALLALAAEADLLIVPQGAHTGLVQAATPQNARRHVVLSTERLRQHFVFDPLD